MNDERYPSLDLAYGWSAQSHQWIQSRLDHHEARKSRSLALAASIALGATALVEGRLFTSPWYLLAMAAFVLLSLVALLGDDGDTFRIIPISTMRAKAYMSHDEFMRSVLSTAQMNWDKNNSLLDRVAARADRVTYLLVAEIILFLGWVVF